MEPLFKVKLAGKVTGINPVSSYPAFFCKEFLTDEEHGSVPEEGFEHFIDQVLALPWRLDNKHFASQYRRITDKEGKLLVDYIGKVEHLSDEYEPIRVKYGFAPLKVYNKSEHGDWRDYYTTKLAKRVYKKYKTDVQYFGYEDSYRKLLEYCKAKGK